jgi:hypothetical protein
MDFKKPKQQTPETPSKPVQPEQKKPRASLYDIEEIDGGGFNVIMPGLIDEKTESIVGTSRKRFETREEAAMAAEQAKKHKFDWTKYEYASLYSQIPEEYRKFFLEWCDFSFITNSSLRKKYFNEDKSDSSYNYKYDLEYVKENNFEFPPAKEDDYKGMEYDYNDGRLPGGRYPKLWIVSGGKIYRFKGKNIPGVCMILNEDYEGKKGQWSSTTYKLKFVEGAEPYHMLADLHHQVWEENSRKNAFEKFRKELSTNVPFEEFDAALERDYPNSRNRMIKEEEE